MPAAMMKASTPPTTMAIAHHCVSPFLDLELIPRHLSLAAVASFFALSFDLPMSICLLYSASYTKSHLLLASAGAGAKIGPGAGAGAKAGPGAGPGAGDAAGEAIGEA
eukprot:CAMPEP_0172851772 /NCGR_PEP_ID=MMETSP1075-20121228/51835_1 /TAXON_ID=2916 /ORGANISM="Ceratium fusus, Strain PA161109" /LENGTH=107 /DNA_ID=CAMNT_0013697839 /DNA_START=110 /DNA_END=430 /DNA_ORIENTATION=+